MPIKLANNTKLGETTSVSKDKNRIENYFDKFNQRTEKPKMEFKKEKYKMLRASRINQLHKYGRNIV